ncbi:MAG: iron-sulfur cluster assembly accessory protein [Gammaproteobacteria bacterium]|nr:iron-sulfur cluster assembly accessory protein [Gammaproteobacteria bacterium]
MTIQTFNPSEISVSERAINHLAQQLRTATAKALHLGVEESGCNGFAFTLDYVSQIPYDSKRFDFEQGVAVYVEPKDWDYVKGTHIDYVTEGLNSMLKFDNPNADSVCGCGESFSLNGT